jgi:hypothetical protein
MLSSADQHQHNEVQPKYIRTVKVPEYFAEYREKGDGLAAFLGSSIVAKVHLYFISCLLHKSEHVVSQGHLSRWKELHLKSGLCRKGAQSGS